jgi:alpha-glucosidase (family GH31 glycosyl hydrolase)
MTKQWNRRELLAQLAGASAGMLLPAGTTIASPGLHIAGTDCEIQLTCVSASTLRLSVLPLERGIASSVSDDGSVVQISASTLLAKLRGEIQTQSFESGNMKVLVSTTPLAFRLMTPEGKTTQEISIDKETGVVSFLTGDTPLLGLGEGGPQFDRRGSTDTMKSGQGGYHLATHGGRVPIPWLVGTSGWAMFFHQPFGTFDFTGAQSRFQPANAQMALPLDIFFVASRDPATIMGEYARLTGHAEMPPLWSFGYQQSHRTLASRDEVLAEAKTFREKKLPCDALIYLGTGFCPSGWNTENGSFVWNSRVFPDPKQILSELHKDNFRTVVHVVILSDKLRGNVHDKCGLARFDEELAS